VPLAVVFNDVCWQINILSSSLLTFVLRVTCRRVNDINTLNYNNFIIRQSVSVQLSNMFRLPSPTLKTYGGQEEVNGLLITKYFSYIKIRDNGTIYVKRRFYIRYLQAYFTFQYEFGKVSVKVPQDGRIHRTCDTVKHC
jgi:hypothetical protein